MGIFFPGIPPYLASSIGRDLGVQTFVETGTHLGATARAALRWFAKVVTIEAAPGIYQQVHQELEALGIDHRFGNSEEVLPAVVSELSQSALFWLDGHWSGGTTFGEKHECPIRGELEAILANNHEHIILIDDARLFLAPPPPPHQEAQWPSIFEIAEAIHEHNLDYWVRAFDDVIVAAPSSLRAPLMAAHHADLSRRAPSRASGLVQRFVSRIASFGHPH